MTDDLKDITRDFWTALDKSRTAMLATLGTGSGPSRPMTAQVDEDITDGSIYFFASRGEGVGSEVLGGADTASFAFQSKDHGLFASAIGPIAVINDQALIDKFWSAMASLYYDDGKRDPDLVLLRFAPPSIEVWRSTTTGLLKAVAAKLLGRDPGQASSDDRATIPV